LNAIRFRHWRLVVLFFNQSCNLTWLPSFFQYPIKDTVVFVWTSLRDLLEKTTQIVIVGFFFKITVAAVLDELCKLLCSASRKLLHSCLALFFTDTVIFVCFRLSRKSLPG
jgi:hypothetical protein